MKRVRDPQTMLVLLFLGLIAAVPLIQVVIEARQEEGVRAFEVFSQPPTSANLRAYERSLEAANWAAQFSRPWIQFSQFEWLKDGGSKTIIGSPGWYFYKPGLQYMLGRPAIPNPASLTNDALTAIVDFRDQLAARGIQLVVMPVPNKESVYPDHLTRRASDLRGVLSPPTRNLLDQLRASDVAVVDLFRAFEEARRHAERQASAQAHLYLAQDTHWSPEGVALAARVAARKLEQLAGVKPGRVDYIERSAPVRRLGDIVRMLQVPAIERRMTPEDVPCAQVVRRDNGELFKETPDAEILLIGDSFARIYQRDEPGAAGFIAHLAKELRQPVLALVNDGGGSTLVRQELSGNPGFLRNKRVVLWEFVERDIGLGIEGWKRVPLPPATASNPPRQSESFLAGFSSDTR